MIKIGLTGGIGAGKSYIAQIIENKGFPVFNSDDQAKLLMTNNAPVIRQVKSIFGAASYQGKELNRPYLAQKIFNDESLKEKLNGIIHPAVRVAFEDWSIKKAVQLKKEGKPSLIFNEAAILFEIGRYKDFNYTILVTAPKEVRMERVIQRDNTTEEQIESRMNNQWSDSKKEELADFIIVNDGIKPVEPQIEEIFKKILEANDLG